jgi:hypothetical protein
MQRLLRVVESMSTKATQILSGINSLFMFICYLFFITEGDPSEHSRAARYLTDAADIAPLPLSLELSLKKASILREDGKYPPLYPYECRC